MIASLFFKLGGTYTAETEAYKLKLNEGMKLSLPCVQTAVYFAQNFDEEASSDVDVTSCFVPQNWGLRIFADGKDTSVSPPSSIGCDFIVGRISVTGPISELKSPVPSFKKKWTVKQPGDVKVKGGLPDISSGKKSPSVCVSIDGGVCFAGVAVVASAPPTDSLSSPDVTVNQPASSVMTVINPYSATFFGVDTLLAQVCFFPKERNRLRFFTNLTCAASELDETASSKWYSMNAFRPADTRFLMLNDTVLSKSWDTLKISLQDSFAAGISRYKSNIECWNNTLFCLSYGLLNVSLGFWCSDFGFTTLSGSDIRNPLRLYGSLSYASCAGNAEIEAYASCMTGISYSESFPAEKREETSARTGVSVSCDDFSVSLDGAAKNLCQEDSFSTAVLETSLEAGFTGCSVVWKAETPLVLVKEDGSDFEWEFSVKPSKDLMGGFSGGISGKFCGMEFSAFECDVSYSSGALKVSAGASVTAAKKVTWTCSASVKI